MSRVEPSRSPATDGYRLVLTVAFGAGEVTAARHRVAAAVRDTRLDGGAADDLVVAINEIMSNVVRHGGGAGELRVWVDGDVLCEVTDAGAGFASAEYQDRAERPRPTPTGGMGLWIAQQTTDGLRIDSGPAGTTVRLVASGRHDDRAAPGTGGTEPEA